jgi:hypothetical protein
MENEEPRGNLIELVFLVALIIATMGVILWSASGAASRVVKAAGKDKPDVGSDNLAHPQTGSLKRYGSWPFPWSPLQPGMNALPIVALPPYANRQV